MAAPLEDGVVVEGSEEASLTTVASMATLEAEAVAKSHGGTFSYTHGGTAVELGTSSLERHATAAHESAFERAEAVCPRTEFLAVRALTHTALLASLVHSLISHMPLRVV